MIQELTFALRRLRHRPLRGAVCVLTLSLGIGASTATYSAVQGVLLDPLPVADQESVVVIWHENPQRDFVHVPFRPEATDVVGHLAGGFTGVAGVETVGARTAIAEGPDGPYPLEHVRVQGDFFGVLGVTPAAGRLLDGRDDEIGADPVAVVSHDYWIRSAAGDRDVLGSTLRYGDRTYTVVGVAPPGFDYPRGTEVWATLRGAHPSWIPDETIAELDIVARLESGVSPEEAAASMRVALAGDGRFDFYADLEPIIVPLAEQIVGRLEPVLEAAMAVAAILLLVAIANATLLFLSGGARTATEVALRRALGAERVRVVAPLVADAALTTALASVLGVALAWAVIEALLPMAPPELPRLEGVALDWSSVLFAVAVAGVAIIGSGGLAGLWFGRGSARDTLMGGARGAGTGGGALRRVIAVTQIAFAMTATVGAGLLARTVDNLGGIDQGFDPEGLYLVHLSHGHSIFEVPDSYVRELRDVTSALEARADVVDASPTLNWPLDFNAGIEIAPLLEGQETEDRRTNPYVSIDAVLPSYFDALGAELRAGRFLGVGDGTADLAVVVVNESAARALWPGGSALGRRLQVFPGQDVWATVVGVVADNHYRSFPEARPAAWASLEQYRSIPPGLLLVRMAEGGEARGAVSEVLAELAPGVRVIAVDPMADIMRVPMQLPRFAAAVLLTFASITLLLAALGVYGVFTVLVEEKGAELGVRMALGARTYHVVRLVTSKVLGVTAAGLVAGVGLSYGLGGSLEALLYGVEAHDIGTLFEVAVATLSLALIAAALPAARAIRTDPSRVLRTD